MRKNLFSRAISLIGMLAVVILNTVVTSCTEEAFEEGPMQEKPVEVKGDTISVIKENTLIHNDWTAKEELVVAENTTKGEIHKVDKNNNALYGIDDFSQVLKMNFAWEALKEDTVATAETLTYMGQNVSGESKVSTTKNGKLDIRTMSKNFTLKFIGKELVINANYDIASFNGNDLAYCRPDSVVVTKQTSSDVETVVISGSEYKRVKTVAELSFYLTDMPAKAQHVKTATTTYTRLVKINKEPGEKVYIGSVKIDGSERYYRLSDSEYRSEMQIKSYYTQDGNTTEEIETIAGNAQVKTWLDAQGDFMIVPSIAIGNPTMKMTSSDSKLSFKEGEIWSMTRTYLFPFVWENGFVKNGNATVEKLYFVREDCKIAMPTAETEMSFNNFVSGNSVEKSYNNKTYNAYPNGKLNFNGSHNGDAINGLSVGQEFYVEKPIENDDLVNVTYDTWYEEENGRSVIEFHIERSVSGKKDSLAYQPMTNSIKFEEKKHFYATSNTFEFKGEQDKNVSNSEYSKDSNTGNFVRTVTTVNNFLFTLTTSKVTTKTMEAYTVFNGEKYYFAAPKYAVSYKDLSSKDMGVVKADNKEYNRTNYVANYNYKFNGGKDVKGSAEFDVDVEKEETVVTRTKWAAQDMDYVYVNDRNWKWFFTIHEEFSDGSQKNTYKEVLLNVYGSDVARKEIIWSSNNFSFLGTVNDQSTTGSRKDGNFNITTVTQPIANKYDGYKPVYTFVHETAVYTDGDITVNMPNVTFNSANGGFTANANGTKVDGMNTYDKYDSNIVLNVNYNGHAYSFNAPFDLLVKKANEPNTPSEWGKIDWNLTQAYGGASWTFDIVSNSLKAYVAYTFVTTNGVVVICDGQTKFYKMNVNSIKGRLSAVRNTQSGNKWIPAYINISNSSSSNPIWNYTGVDGKSNSQVPGSAIVKLTEKIDVKQPWLFTGNGGNSVGSYQYSDGRLVITHNGKVIFDGTSEK